MYCSHCGSAAHGKFCAECGTALLLPVSRAGDWENVTRYDVLMRIAEVRAAIDEHAKRSRQGMTGEQYLALCDKVVPCGVSFELLASIIQPLYASWGIGTGKQRGQAVQAPVGRVIVRVLCSLAKNGQSIQHVQQASDGCMFTAALPSDLWSLKGELVVAVRAAGLQTAVEAATMFKGQFFDWGKSSRILDRLFADLQVDPAPALLERLPRVA